MSYSKEYGSLLASKGYSTKKAFEHMKAARQQAGKLDAIAVHTPNVATNCNFAQYALQSIWIKPCDAAKIVKLFSALKEYDARTLAVAERGSAFANEHTDLEVFETARKMADLSSSWTLPVHHIAKLRFLI